MKAVPIILILVAFLGITTLAVVVRAKRAKGISTSRHYLSKPPPKGAVPTSVEMTYDTPADRLPPPAPATESEKAIRATSVKSALIKYRTAVAAGNRQAQAAMLTSLKRHQDLAISIADEDLRNATRESERNSIRNALEAIRR